MIVVKQAVARELGYDFFFFFFFSSCSTWRSPKFSGGIDSVKAFPLANEEKLNCENTDYLENVITIMKHLLLIYTTLAK